MRRICIAVFVLIALSSFGCDYIEPPLAASGRALRRFWGQTPIKAARMMQDPTSADRRREGINRLVDYDFGKHEPYLTRYRQIALNDPDFTVRAVAVRALNRARDHGSTDVFIKSL